jgi:WD40 repeat protein
VDGQSVRAISTDAERGIVLVAAGDWLYYSTDSGATFSDATPAQGEWVPLVAPDALLALGPDGDYPTLTRSTDGGQTWAPVSEVPCAASHIAVQARTGILVAWGYPVVENFCFVTSSDGGVTWTPVSPPSDQGLLRPLGFEQGAFYTAVRYPDRHDDLFRTTSFTAHVGLSAHLPASTTRYLSLFDDRSSRATYALASVSGDASVWRFEIAATNTVTEGEAAVPQDIAGNPPSLRTVLASAGRWLVLSPGSGRLYERIAQSATWTALCDARQPVLSWDVVVLGNAVRVLLGTSDGLYACDLAVGSAYAYQLLQVSVPRVSALGELAYVDAGQLVVLGANGQRRVVAQGVQLDVEWVPDGSRLLYTIEQNGSAARYAWDTVTAEVQPVDDETPAPQPDPPSVALPDGFIATGASPLPSPDGRWVALHVEETAAPGVDYTLLSDTSGLSPTRVITGAAPVTWSPDGRLLAGYTCTRTCGLVVLDALSGEVTPIATEGRLEGLSWSPQGTYLAYGLSAHNGALMLWDRASGEHRMLVSGNRFADIAWAPDGCGLYAAQREPGGGLNAPVQAIWGVGPNWSHVWRVAPMANPEIGLTTCPTSTLMGRRLVAYYGTPAGPGLGILGRNGLSETLTLLQQQIAAYRDIDPDTAYVPAFHMVTTIADAYAGEDGDYNHRVPHDVILPWIEGARAAGGVSILDVQPAHAEVGVELALIEPLLREPGVHLAVDPEFIMAEDDHIPGTDLGSITGDEINRIQAWLDALARETGERKMLIIHQFNDRMMRDKEAILHYPMVDLVWDSDGFGSPGAKVGDYIQYSGETGFEYGGFKIFYRYDTPVMTPEEVLGLDPLPALIIYQ